MDVDSEMLRWSQTVYGVAHALHVARSINFGNLNTIIESLRAAEAWNPSVLGFESNVPAKSFVDGSVKLDGDDHQQVFARLAENIVDVLFVSLAVQADVVIGYLIEKTGQKAPDFLFSKIEWTKSRISEKQKWAINGLFEVVALRNALVHGAGSWSETTVQQLRKAGIEDVDTSARVSLSFGDLFRYRRALRTVVGELRTLPADGAV